MTRPAPPPPPHLHVSNSERPARSVPLATFLAVREAGQQAQRDLEEKTALLRRHAMMFEEFLSAIPLEKREQIIGAGLRDVADMDDIKFGALLSRLKFTLSE